jgi:putative hemin transport protein
MNNETLMKEVDKDYAVNVALKNGITEGELTNKRLFHDARILAIDDIKSFISELEFLGVVKCISRNSSAINIQDGVLKNQYLNGYKNINVSSEAGLILNPRGLDLRVFFKHWNHVFYIEQFRNNQLQFSFQVFNKLGDAICKIYLTDESNLNVRDSILEKYIAKNQNPVAFEKKIPAPSSPPHTQEYSEEIDLAWRNMKDVHDFYLIMHKYKLTRQEIFQSVGDDLAFMVSNLSLNMVLQTAKQNDEELTIFVANTGCVQIYTGLIERIVLKDRWMNIYNTGNKIHISHDEIDECWVVKKNGEFGPVSCLEVFNKNGEQMLQIYGQRNEGEPERDTWKKIVGVLS